MASVTAPPSAPTERRWLWAGIAVVACLVPLAFLGPGTDLDVGAVIHSGRSIVRDHTYVASRSPGVPVHETAVGVLERLGRTVGPNLGSLVAACALVALLALLMRAEGVSRVGLSCAVVVANPFFLIAAVSTVDFLWALAFWAGAALVVRRAAAWPAVVGAGALAGLAIGCRSSTAFLVVGLAVAHALGRPPDAVGRRIDGESTSDEGAPPPWAAALGTLVVAGIVGMALYIPSFRAAGSSLAFAQNDVPTSSLGVQLGRFLVKDLYFFGPFAAVVLLLAVPATYRAVLRWRVDWLVRVGAITLVISQVLFLRFPWKMGHLLPTLVGLALILARALGDRPRLLWALVATQVLYGLVSVTLITPDNPNAATGGRLTFQPRWGALVTDVRCRADDPDAWEGPGIGRIDAVWDCAKPWAERAEDADG